MAPQWDVGIDPNNEEGLARLNASLAALGIPDGITQDSGATVQPGTIPDLAPATTALSDTPAALMPQHGVPTPTGQSADLAMSSHDASIVDLKSRQATAQQNALDMLQKALNNQPEISSSQGIAAALLAAIPAIGGGLIGKMVGSPKIPAGTYFPGMSAQAFNQEFGVGGKAAAAEGVQIGGAAALDYLNRVQKDQVNKTPILEKMAGLYSQQANTLEGRLATAEQNKLNAEDRNVAREDQQKFLHEERGLAREDAAARNPKAGWTQEQIDAEAAKRSGRNKDGTPYIDPAKMQDVSPTATTEIRAAKKFADHAFQVAGELEGIKTWAEFRAKSVASGLNADAVIRDLQELIAEKIHALSGTAASAKEFERISGFTKGDMSAPPSLIIKYVRAAGEFSLAGARSVMETDLAMNDPAKREHFLDSPAPKVSEGRLKHIESLIAKGG